MALWAADPSARTGLIAGSNYPVANAGNSTGYRYAYAITSGTTKPAWSEASNSVPTTQGRAAGTYRVYWADRNSNNAVRESEWNGQNHYFEVTIGELSLSSVGDTYDGEKHDFPDVRYDGTGIANGITYDGVTWTIAWTKGGSSVTNYQDAATYTCTVTTKSGNTTHGTGTLTFQVAKGTNWFDPDALAIEGWTYEPDTYASAPKNAPSGATPRWGEIEYQYRSTGSWGTYAAVVGGNAGDYQVRAHVAADGNNYDAINSAPASFTIAKAKATFGTVEVTAASENMEYTNSAQPLIKVTGTPVNGVMQYKVGTGSYGNSIPTGTAATTYTVSYYVKGNTNYEDTEVKTIDVTIKPANPTFTAGAVKTVTYTGDLQALIQTAPTPTSPATGTIRYYIKGVDAGTVAGNVTAKDADDYVITYTFTSSNTNYNSVTEAKTLGTAKINRANWPTAKIKDPTLLADWTYDGDEHALITAPAEAEGVIAADKAAATDFVYYLNDVETPIANIKALNANETAGYKVSYSIKETTNYNKVDKKDLTPVKVNRATLHMGAQGQNVVYASAEYAALTYASFIKLDENEIPKGSKVETAAWIKENLVKFTSFEGTTITDGKPTDIPEDVEVYDFVLEPKDANSNYKLVDFIPGGALTITQADGVAATVAAAPRTFDNTEKPLVTVTGAPVGGEMLYFVGDAAPAVPASLENIGTEWKKEVPQAKDAKDSYKVWYMLKGDKNHKDGAIASVDVKIAQAKPVISDLTLANWQYGTTPTPAPTATVDLNFVGNITYTYAVQGSTTFDKYENIVNNQVGKYTVKASVAADASDAKNWVAADDVTKNFEITKAPLTITAKNASKVYGAAEPTVFEYTVDPKFQFEDNAETIGLTITRTLGNTVGTYLIKPEVDADKAKNYNITLINGTFTISKAALTIEIDNKSKVYGTDDPDFTAAFKGLTNGDEPDDIALEYSRTTGEDVTEAGKEYVISATAKGTAASNYTISYETGKLTITPAPLTLTAKALTKVYGEEDPEFVLANEPAYKLTDDATAIGLTITRAKGENVGTYVITPAATSKNYTYEIETADFEITPAPLVYTLTNAEYTYTGDQLEPIEGEVFVLTEGKFFFDDSYGKEGTFYFTFGKDVIDATTYNFIILEKNWNEEIHNYNVVFKNEAVVTINPAEVVVTAPVADNPTYSGDPEKLIATAASAKFGETPFAFEYTLGELKSKDATKIVAIDATEYEIAWKVDDETGNFKFVDAEGKPAAEGTITAEIGKATIAVTKPVAAEDLVYTGAPLNVIATAATATFGETEFNVQYSTEEDGTYTDELTITAAGDYTIYSKVIDETGNFEEAPIDPVNVSIDKATISVTKPVAATGLEYKKEDLTLIATAAEASVAAETDTFEPVVLYSLTGEEDSFDAALPKAQNANEAGYDVYYKVNGDDNHYDVAAASIKAAIAKRELMATTPSAVKTYDGEATVEAAEFDEEIKYNGLFVGDEIDLGGKTPDQFVNVPEDAINVGEYELTMNVADFPEQQNYYVGTAVPGKLTINKAKPVIIGFANNDPTYTKHYAQEYEFALAAGDLAVYGVNPFFDDFAVLVPGNVNKDQLSIDASQVGEDFGEYAIKPQLTSKATFQNNYESVEFAAGVFEITKAEVELRVSIAAASKTYDGKEASLKWADDLSNMVVTGLPEGKDKAGIFTTLPTIEIANASANAGDYNINLKDGVSKNYEFKIMEGSYYTIEPVVVSAVFNSIPVAKEGDKGADILGQVKWAVEAIDEADEAALTADKAKFELTFAKDVLDEDGNIAEGEDGKGALVISYKQAEDETEPNFIFDENGNTADLYIEGTAGPEIALNDSEEIITFASEGATVTFTESRNVAKDTWQACVLPFDVTPAQISDAFGYAAVDVFDEDRTTGDEIHFSLKVTGNIEAGTPFLFKADNKRNFDGTAKDEEGNLLPVVFNDVKVANTADLNPVVVDQDTKVKFIGTFKATTLENEGYCYMSQGTWYDTMDGKKYNIKPLRAYLDLTEKVGGSAARIFIEEPDGTTSIMDINSFNNMLNADSWYTIEGKKLNAAPTQKGVYIQNGKKVVIK
jgi:hypothetical protein